MAYPTLFHAVGTQCLVSFFFRSCASSWFSSQGQLILWGQSSLNWTTLQCLSAFLFELCELEILEMSWDTLNFPVTSSIQLLHIWIFCFLTRHSPSLRNWIMGYLAVKGCWFAVSHCALNNSMIISNTLLCRQVYIWSYCGHADSTWRKVSRSLFHDKYWFESVYSHNFRLVAFGKRSCVERRRNDIASSTTAIKDFYDNLIGSISFHFVQTHCLAWVTALAVLCSSSNILTSSLTMSRFPFGPILEDTLLLVLSSPARLVWVTPMMS